MAIHSVNYQPLQTKRTLPGNVLIQYGSDDKWSRNTNHSPMLNEFSGYIRIKYSREWKLKCVSQQSDVGPSADPDTKHWMSVYIVPHSIYSLLSCHMDYKMILIHSHRPHFD